MKILASSLLAAAICALASGAASACPYSDKSASLTDSGSYDTAQNQSSSSKAK